MEAEKYIPKNFIEKLKSKGLTEEFIDSQVQEIIKSGKEKFPGNYENYVKNRVKAKFTGFINSDEKIYTAVVIGQKKIDDENNRMKRMSKIKEGTFYTVPGSSEKVEVKEGYYPWGFNIGEPIPDEPDWQQEYLLAVENENKLTILSVTFKGDWLLDKNANVAKPGDKIKFKGIDIFNKKNVSAFGYEHEGKISDEKFNGIVDKYLVDKKKTIEQLNNKEFENNEIVVVKGDIAEFSPKGNSTLIKFMDETSEWGEESDLITTYIDDTNFTEDAIGVTFIGDVYEKKNDGGIGFNTYITLVPKEFKPVETPKETEEIAQDNLEDNSDENDLMPTQENNEEVDDLL